MYYKKIQYLGQHSNNIPAILWVLFHHPNIGRQRRHHYSHLYVSGIQEQWIPIFAITWNFKCKEVNITRTQFPLWLAASTTICAEQGSTFDQICMNMNLSSSPTFMAKTGWAKYCMCHTHYVAASRVTSVEGLHIINWNGDFLGIHYKVEQLLKSMKECPLQICYTPTYDLNGDMKVTYLNTASLHKYFDDVQHSHSIISSDAFILSETRLNKLDKDTIFHTSQFNGPYRNDQECNILKRSHHGMAAYIKNNLCLPWYKNIEWQCFWSYNIIILL